MNSLVEEFNGLMESELEIKNNINTENESNVSKSSDNSRDCFNTEKSQELKNTKNSNPEIESCIESHPEPEDVHKDECLECETKNRIESKVKQSSEAEVTKKVEIPLKHNWGESIGIFDKNGNMKRVVLLEELKNFCTMNVERKSKFKFFLALIDNCCPRLLYRSKKYESQWLMRYNIFVNNVFVNRNESSVLHIGEIHLYFKISSRFVNPYYVKRSFYGDCLPIEEVIDSSLINEMSDTLKVLLTSEQLLRIKFPIADNTFKNCDSLYERFNECQQKLMSEAMIVFQDYWIPYGKTFEIHSKNKFQNFKTVDKFVMNDRITTRADRIAQQKNKTSSEKMVQIHDSRNEKEFKTEKHIRNQNFDNQNEEKLFIRRIPVQSFQSQNIHRKEFKNFIENYLVQNHKAFYRKSGTKIETNEYLISYLNASLENLVNDWDKKVNRYL